MKLVRVRWHVMIAIALAPIYAFAFTEQCRSGGRPDESLEDFTSYPATLEISGRDARIKTFPVGSVEEVRLLATGFEPEPPARARLSGQGDADAKTFELERRHDLAHLIITFLNGLLFWGVGLIVFAPRTTDRAAREFFWTSMLFGLAVMIDDITFPGQWPSSAHILGMTWIVVLAILPLLFLRLCLVFPRRNPFLDRWRWFLPSLWCLSLGLAAWRVISYLNYFAEPRPELFFQVWLSSQVIQGLLVAEAAAAIAILYRSSRRLELPREREQTRWLLWGIAVGVTPYVFLRCLPRLFGADTPVPPAVDRLFELAIPISFCLAVIRYQFLDIDIIIRRSVIYGTLAALAVTVYVVLALPLGKTLEDSDAFPYVMVGIGALAGVMFLPLRHRIGIWVDRTFFEIRHDHDRLIGHLNRRLETAVHQDDVVAHLDAFLRSTLRPKTHAVVVRFDGQTGIGGRLDADIVPRVFPSLAAMQRKWTGPLAATGTTSRPEIESTAFPASLEAEGIVLMQPIRTGDTLAGFILVGHKRTERRFVEPDLELLARVAESAAVVLERMQLVQRAAEEGSARRRSDEMNRLKSEFLSHIAHDLRSPLASITWSVDNLLDGVVEGVPPQVADYLGSIKASARHLNRLVANLLEISRLERGTAELVLEPLTLEAIVTETVASMSPLADEKNVTLEIERLGPSRVRGNREKVQEVVVNLVDNAIKYAPPGSSVVVSVGRFAGGATGLAVRDHGPGVPAEERESIFERFRQGSPSPDTRRHGFGLGLHIVREYLHRMGGRVWVENHADGGAVFTCTMEPIEA